MASFPPVPHVDWITPAARIRVAAGSLGPGSVRHKAPGGLKPADNRALGRASLRPYQRPWTISADVNAATVTRPVRRLRLRHSLALFVPALIFGYLVAQQAISQTQRSELATRYNAPLIDSANALQKEQSDLKAQLADLRTKLDDIQKASATQSGIAGDLSRQIEELQSRTGLTALTGEGVMVQLDDAHTSASVKDVDKAICHNTDITDIVNTGWRAGA